VPSSACAAGQWLDSDHTVARVEQGGCQLACARAKIEHLERVVSE
jgi:hypothetical protein